MFLKQPYLEPYHWPASRHTCPACRKPRCFTLYLHGSTGLPIHPTVGAATTRFTAATTTRPDNTSPTTRNCISSHPQNIYPQKGINRHHPNLHLQTVIFSHPQNIYPQTGINTHPQNRNPKTCIHSHPPNRHPQTGIRSLPQNRLPSQFRRRCIFRKRASPRPAAQAARAAGSDSPAIPDRLGLLQLQLHPLPLRPLPPRAD